MKERISLAYFNFNFLVQSSRWTDAIEANGFRNEEEVFDGYAKFNVNSLLLYHRHTILTKYSTHALHVACHVLSSGFYKSQAFGERHSSS